MTQDVIEIDTVMTAAPVIPVLIIDDPSLAVPLAQALVRGGLPAIEVTLRTPAALAAVKAIAESVDGAIPGVGTVLDDAQFEAASKAGARFAVSPGATDELLKSAANHALPLLPGAATASEVMRLLEQGYSRLKLFPAAASGGVSLLASLASPLPQARFCPTGGITPTAASSYLALPNVVCVGGSWIAPPDAITAQDWSGIEQRARDAASLSGVQ